MKKRILSLLLVICMVVGMLPASVFAADETDNTASETLNPAIFIMLPAAEGYNGGIWTWKDVKYASITLQPGDGPQYYKTDASGHLMDGTAEDYNVKFSYEGKAAQMYLKGATIANETADTNVAALYLGHPTVTDHATRQANYEIIVEGDSYINQGTGSSGYAIYNGSVGTLTVTSVNNAKLAVKGMTTATRGVFQNEGSLVLKDANLYVGGYNSNIHYAIYAKKNIDIIGGNVQAWARGDNKTGDGGAVYAAGDMTIDKAKVTGYVGSGVTLRADGAKGVTIKDSNVLLGNYSSGPALAAAPKLEYADGYSVKTDTAQPKSSVDCPTTDTFEVAFRTSATTSDTLDAAAAATYKVFQVKPANNGYVRIPQNDTATSFHNVTIEQGGDSRYFIKVDTDDNGVKDTFTEENASETNYNIKIAYPFGGDVMVYLKGATIASETAGKAALYLGNPDDATQAANLADYEIIVESDSAINQTNGTTSSAIDSRTTGTLTIRSVNDAKLVVKGNRTGNTGVLATKGSLALKDANLYVGGYNSAIWHAIYVNGNIDITGGKVQAHAVHKSAQAAIYATGDITVDKAHVIAYSHNRPAFKADGENGVTLKDSWVLAGSYGGTAFAEAPNIAYEDGYVVKTDTGYPYAYNSSAPAGDSVLLTFHPTADTVTTSNTLDVENAATYKMFEIKPANKGNGTVKLPSGDTQTSYAMAMGDDAKYFDVVDGIPVEITERANFKDYKLKLSYPVSGVLTVTLNGAQLTGTAMYGIGVVTSATCPAKIVTEADSTVIGSNNTTGSKGMAFSIEGGGDVTFTSVNDATLTVSGKLTGTGGYINGNGNITFENANMQIDGYTRDSGGSGYAVNASGNVTVKGGNFVHTRPSGVKATTVAGFIGAQNIYFEDTNVMISAMTNINTSWSPAYFNARAAENPTIQIKNSVFEAGITSDYGGKVGLFNVAPTLVYDGCYTAKGTTDVAKFEAMTNPVTLKSGDANAINYRHVEVVPVANHAVATYETDETHHRGVCACGYEFEEEAHIKGPEQMEDLKEANETTEGSYNLVTRCSVCDYIMASEHRVIPIVEAAYVWFFNGDNDDQVPVKVTNNGVARYLKTKDGKILKDADGNVVEGSENDYNIKLVYESNVATAELTFQNAELVNDYNGSLVQLGYSTTNNFSVDIILKGTTNLTSNGTTNYHAAIGSVLDADQKVRILGDGTLNLFATTNNGGSGVIGVPDLTIEAGATVNTYNIGTGYPICVSTGSGNLTVNGNLGAYTLNNKTYSNTLSNGSVVYIPTIKVAGDIFINEGATVTIRSRQRAYAFDAGGEVYINNATVDALIGAGLTTTESNPSSPGTYVFKKAPILSGELDAQGTVNRSYIDEDYQIVGEPVLQRYDQFDANVLTYQYVKITPHECVFESKVSDQKKADATCEHGDLYYVQCRNCDRVSDTVTVETTKPAAHTWADATCTSGKVCSVCGEAYSYNLNPYYLVNLAGMGGNASATFSNAYQMPQFWTDANYVPKLSGEADVVEIAKDLKAIFDTYPIGTRFINFTMVGKAFKGTYESGIYMDEGVKLVQNWLKEFLPAYKAIGGQLDGVSVDLEFEYGRGYDLRNIYNGKHHTLAQDTQIYWKIYNDPRFVSTGMKQMMEERGVTFDESAADPLYIVHTDSTAYSAYNEAFNILMNRYIDEAMAPLFDEKYYPDAQLTDYDRGYSEAWQSLGMTDSKGNVNPGQGTSTRVGNSSNMSLYMMEPTHLIFNPSSGNYGQKPYGYNLGEFLDTPFNAAKWNVERFKQMLAATDDKKVSVWISEFEYFQTNTSGETHAAHTNGSPYYSEAILHLGLANPYPFIGYVKPPVIESADGNYNDVETYNLYLDTVNDLMLELTKVAGTDDRRPIELPYSWNDGYILSGMYAGGRNIWRITPDEGYQYDFLEMSENGTPTFRAGGQTIVFPQGRIIETGEISNVGTCGYWVETPDGVNPVVISDENRYSADNGFTGTANRAELYVYDKYGYLVDASVANEGFTAYHVSWMNVDNTYKYLIIKNNGEKIREVLMAPGQDSFVVGEIASGSNLLTVETVEATGYVAEDPYASDDFFWADATKPNHDYKYVDNGDGTHDYACDCGEEGAVAIDNEAHEFADDNDTTCDKCGYERQVGLLPPSVEYSAGQTAQIRLIEPWGLKFNARVYTQGMKSNESIDYSKVYSYGAYIIRASELSTKGLTQNTITLEDIINDEDAVHYTKENGGVVVDASVPYWITATYAKDLYTYEFDDSLFVVFYVVTNEGEEPFYLPIRERNILNLLETRKDDTSGDYYELEKAVYSYMYNLYYDVTDYRSDFTDLTKAAKQKAPTLAEYKLGATAATNPYKFGHTVQIRLVEPWGMKANARVSTAGMGSNDNIDYAALEEYGAVVIFDNNVSYERSDVEALLAREDAYVFSSKNGDAIITQLNGASVISVTYNKDLFTYQLDTKAFVMFYVKDADGYHYGDVRERNLYSLMNERKDDTSGDYTAKEQIVYQSMLNLYDAVTVYRDAFFSGTLY